jgi:hypothetical protein
LSANRLIKTVIRDFEAIEAVTFEFKDTDFHSLSLSDFPASDLDQKQLKGLIKFGTTFVELVTENARCDE